MIKKEIRKRLKSRSKTSHKNDFGRIFILAGSKKYSGAAYLAGLAALRAGAGLVTLGVPDAIMPAVARRQPELIIESFPSTKKGSLSRKSLKAILKAVKNQDILAVGPGLSQEKETQRLVREVLKKTKQPVVLDADGLNALKNHLSVLKALKNRCILTPHPGEFLRLFGGKLTASDKFRTRRAKEAAKKFGVYIVLKGHHTVIAAPDGKVCRNSTGNPGMATAGSGDVLTGILAAFAGQKLSLWDTARFGVYLHGLAGDLAAHALGELSLIAGDLIDYFPKAVLKTLTR